MRSGRASGSAGGPGWRSPGWPAWRCRCSTCGGFQLQVGFDALVFALLALGLNIVVGWAGLLDLGYIAFFGFGAYGYALLSSAQLGSTGTHLPYYLSLPIVMIGAACSGSPSGCRPGG